MLLKEVFIPDYYYFLGEKLREKYNPGHQAANNLHILRLQVGQQYTYEIHATSKQEWRARVLHTVCWQASIDGHVTLKPVAGGLLPVEGMMVNYILKDLGGGCVRLGIVLSSWKMVDDEFPDEIFKDDWRSSTPIFVQQRCIGLHTAIPI